MRYTDGESTELFEAGKPIGTVEEMLYCSGTRLLFDVGDWDNDGLKKEEKRVVWTGP
jgi:hypothetical protein